MNRQNKCSNQVNGRAKKTEKRTNGTKERTSERGNERMSFSLWKCASMATKHKIGIYILCMCLLALNAVVPPCSMVSTYNSWLDCTIRQVNLLLIFKVSMGGRSYERFGTICKWHIPTFAFFSEIAFLLTSCIFLSFSCDNNTGHSP